MLTSANKLQAMPEVYVSYKAFDTEQFYPNEK